MDNIGKVLRQARIDQGMTIDDLQKKTRIQKRYLIAIENGDFDQLPGQFYVRAFIKQYGENVGIDTESYFKTVEKTEQSDDSVKQVKEEEEQTPSNLNAENRSSYLTRQQPENRWHSLIPQILVIAAVILVVFIVWLFYKRANPSPSGISEKGKVTSVKSSSVSQMRSSKSTSSKKASSSKSSVVSQSKSVSSSKSSEKEPTQSVALKSQSGSNYTFEITGLKASGNKLILSAVNSNACDKVIVDGATLYSGLLSAGQSTTVSLPDGAQIITMTLGATANSKVTINDQIVDFSAITTPGVSNLTFNIVKK